MPDLPTLALQAYLAELRHIAAGPSATETSYAPSLIALIRALAGHLTHPLVNLTLQPGQVTAAGAPDAALYGPTANDLIGYIEMKDITKDLDGLIGHDLQQFNRYKAAFHAWIFTNYLEFRLYENDTEVQRLVLCSEAEVRGTASLPRIAGSQSAPLASMLDRFLQQSIPTITDAEKLASLLAHKARLLEGALLTQVTTIPPDTQLISQLESYRKWLITDLTPAQFADFYAQTLVYGLFFASVENSRRATRLPFDRSSLLELLPQSVNPVRTIFQLLAARLLPHELDWILDDLMRLLDRADIAAITTGLGQSRDPIVHFYETFLSRYDPELREMRGVYYTPDEVVDYIVRSVDGVVRARFGRGDGLASPGVTVLDPALGTGTFLVHVYRQVASNFGKAHAGNVADHLREHTLEDSFGFELLAAPYVLAHLKLGQALADLGLPDGKPRVYLTNTLSEHEFPTTLPGPFEQAISEDGRAAQRLKAHERILVVVGNPPYSGTSHNVYGKVDDYRVPGERARNWLQNDYVKFIRWAEWKIAEFVAGGFQHGVVAFITDHSYLRAPSFRGMRKHLLDRFGAIYILNLHGNSRYREIPPPGVTLDENVFDIQQGTAIAIFVREAGHVGPGQVFYADIWGERQAKYDYLSANDVMTTNWIAHEPEAPFYFFAPRDMPRLSAEYQTWPSVTELFPIHSQAVITARDDFVSDVDRQALWDRMEQFADPAIPDEEIAERYALWDTRTGWRVADARQRLMREGLDPNRLVPFSYRPFDDRWIYYSTAVVWRARRRVSVHMLGDESVALVTFRHTRRPTTVRALAVRHLADARLLSTESNCYTFPLYTYMPQVGITATQRPIGLGAGAEHAANLPSGLLDTLNAQYQRPVTPLEIFDYVYGVLNAPGYQSEFSTLLHDDFARIPFTVDYDAFAEMFDVGRRLRELHTLEAGDLQALMGLLVGFPVSGDNVIRDVRLDEANARLYISTAQYFDGVTRAVWEYKVGDHAPLQAWVAERHGTPLLADDLRHFETFATAVRKALDEVPRVESSWQGVRNGGWFNPLVF